MAAVTLRVPAWTRHENFTQLFHDEARTLGAAEPSQQSYDGHAHIPMAARGNEVFYAVGKSIRWTDFTRFRTQQRPFRNLNLKRSFPEPIQQLAISPNEEFMAVVTKHSVSVIVLPDISIFSADETSPVSVKRHTIGETTHVRQTPAIAKVLWHPLGLDGNCLVTITVASVVRLWELDRRNLVSFSVPSLAIDLVKLRHAESQEEDTSSRDMNYNKAFSIDSAEMAVTGACFGANANEAQAFEWSATTLWLTMAEGDIFALCPLLPSRFQLDDDGTITTLWELKNAQKHSLEADEVFGSERTRIVSQCAWLHELKHQYEKFEDEDYNTSSLTSRRVYYRPRNQGSTPKLQGPFVIIPNEAQDDLMPCDIHVVGANVAAGIGARDLQSHAEEEISAGLSFSIVTILGIDGRVHICADMDGVEPRWLPAVRTSGSLDEIQYPAELVLFEALDTLTPKDKESEQFPTLTADTAGNEYSFFVSHRKGVYKVSLDPWVHELEKEVQHAGTQGVQFRAQILARGTGSKRERVFQPDTTIVGLPLAKPLLLNTEELGHVILIIQGQQPQALLFSEPGYEDEPEPLNWKSAHAFGETSMAPVRDLYYPPPAFSQPSALSTFMDKSIEARHKRHLKDEIRLSSATLVIMTEAHRVLSLETTALNDAAADLFRRCDRLHDEFKHQIERMNEVVDRIRSMNEEEGDSVSGRKSSGGRKADVETRLGKVREKQIKILKRHDELRQKLSRAGGKPLNGKEKAWIVETKKIESSVGVEEQESQNSETRQLLCNRFKEVQSLAQEILQQVQERDGPLDPNGATANGHPEVPSNVRRDKIVGLEGMLDRETELLNSAVSKLARLGVAAEI